MRTAEPGADRGRRKWAAILLAVALCVAWTAPARAQSRGPGPTPDNRNPDGSQLLPLSYGSTTWPVVNHIATNDPVVFVTIDDGVTQSPDAYNAIRARGWPVANFVLPNYLRNNPSYFQAIGNPSDFGTHTITHPSLTSLSYAQQRSEICGGRDQVAAVIGSQPGWFRAPYGNYNASTVAAAQSCGFPGIVLWDVTVDGSVISYAGNSIVRGDIILLHYTPNLALGIATLAARLDQAGLRPARLASYLPPVAGSAASSANVDLNGPTSVFSGPNRQDVFARSSSGAIYQRVWTAAAGLSGWNFVGGNAQSSPDAASQGDGYSPQVFVRGADGAAWQQYWNGSGWVTQTLGGICVSGPSAVYSGPDRLDVFCRGADLHTWSKAWTSAGGWSGWYSIGGLSTSDPDAASPGPGTSPQVFVRGVDNAVWQQYWNGSGWIGQTLGGACQSGPSAVYSGPNRLDVFCRGTDARLWAKVWTSATGWSGWNLVGGLSTSDPDAASRGKTSTPQTVVRGSDDNVWQAYWTGSAWAWQSWGSPG